MNGRGTRFDRAFDHSSFHAMYEDYAQLERERAVAATVLAKSRTLLHDAPVAAKWNG
ncbi:MAG: hypothetical protein V3T86_05795 [Planctomycetota bacterium]